MDGFKDQEGNPLTKSVRMMKVLTEETGFFLRYQLTRGYTYDLCEDVYCVTKDPLDMPYRSGKHFPDRSNRSNYLGPVAMPPFTAEHHHMLPWKMKSMIFSEKAKNACKVGGSCPDGTQSLQRRPETLEPVSWHQPTWKFWAEIFHSHNVVGVVDFTAGAGYVAEAAIHEKVPYLGIGVSIAHVNTMRQYLFGRVWDMMQKPGSEHYSSELHEALGHLEALLIIEFSLFIILIVLLLLVVELFVLLI